ncbi:MAG: hypothetical protein WBC40_06265 [Halobacteriota archaeon]
MDLKSKIGCLSMRKKALICIAVSTLLIVLAITIAVNYSYKNQNKQDLSYIHLSGDPTLDLPWKKTFSDAITDAKRANKLIFVHFHLQDMTIDYKEGYNTPGTEHRELWMDAYFQLFVLGNETVKEFIKDRFVLLRVPYPSDHIWQGIKLKDPTVVLVYNPTKKTIKQESMRYNTFSPDYMNTTTKEEEKKDIDEKTAAFLAWLEVSEYVQ